MPFNLTGLGAALKGGVNAYSQQADESQKRALLAQQQTQQKQAALAAIQAMQNSAGQQQQGKQLPWIPGAEPYKAPSFTGNQNTDSIINSILTGPGDPEAKFAAMQNVGAFLTPFDKLQTQTELGMAKLQSAGEVAQARLDALKSVAEINANSRKDVQGMKDKTTEDVTDKKITASGNKQPSLANDPIYQGLKNDVSVAKAEVINAPPNNAEKHDAAMARYNDANKKLAAYERQKKTASVGEPPAATGGAEERVTVTKDGQDFTLPKSQLQDAIAQGYKQK